jgi:hypothetical protein
LVNEPLDHDSSALNAGFAVKTPGFPSVGAIDVSNDVQLDGGVFLHPFKELFCYALRPGVKAALISNEVDAEDVGSLTHLNGPEVDFDVGLSE